MSFAEDLLSWYQQTQRNLPWRNLQDPYAIWVSEIMLQQTRVETVIPYFNRWMESFPNVYALANADRQDVLNHWEGLGYYRRAHNLHRAAQIVVDEYAGDLPKDMEQLKKLPGIGDYTAAAISSLAFGHDALALDGNLRRVLARLFDRTEDPRSSKGERILRELGSQYLPAGSAASFNQALMDLGSKICTPRNPSCGECPVAAHCLAFERGVQEQRPVRKKRGISPHVDAAAAVIVEGGNVLIGRRPENKLLGGLWEFPGGKMEQNESLPECLQREILEELGIEILVGESLGKFENAYTHFRVAVHAFYCQRTAGEPQPLDHSALEWVSIERLDDYPMGKVDRMIANHLQMDQAKPESG